MSDNDYNFYQAKPHGHGLKHGQPPHDRHNNPGMCHQDLVPPELKLSLEDPNCCDRLHTPNSG